MLVTAVEMRLNTTDHTLLRGTAIPAAFITEEMDNSRSRRQVLILDCKPEAPLRGEG